MRRFWVLAAMLGSVSAAHAADMPDLPVLRGTFTDGLTKSSRSWEGAYVGGQVGYEAANMDFSRSIVSLTNFIFRNSVLQAPTSQWSLLTKQDTQGTSFGGFIGYNWQWEDAVFGLEANYNYMNRVASSSSSSLSLAITNPTGSTPPPNHTYTYNTTLTGQAALTIKDVTTFRARAGWAAGDFMPYMFGGFAVGRMDVSRSVSSDVVLRDDQVVTTTNAFGGTTTANLAPVFSPVPAVSTSTSEHKSNQFVPGWTAGLGIEWCMWGGLFLRGEWEYIKFATVKDTTVSLNSARLGIGYKF